MRRLPASIVAFPLRWGRSQTRACVVCRKKMEIKDRYHTPPVHSVAASLSPLLPQNQHPHGLMDSLVCSCPLPRFIPVKLARVRGIFGFQDLDYELLKCSGRWLPLAQTNGKCCPLGCPPPVGVPGRRNMATGASYKRPSRMNDTENRLGK